MKVLYGHENTEEVVLAFGNFDGIHRGHLHIFSEVKRLANELCVRSAVLTFLPHTAVFLRNKRNFLLLDFDSKVQLIGRCNIDYLHVVDFGEALARMPAEAFITDVLVKGCKAKHVVVGSNCVFGHKCGGDIEMLRHYSADYGYGVTVVEQLTEGDLAISSSCIRECVQCGDIRTANLLLGRRYVISGEVIRGSGRGSLIGFPTLNLNMDYAVLPKRGVYSARVDIGGTDTWLPGIVNIGIRPTFSDTEASILEMYIFDFDKSIYGCRVSVELIEFVRPERKFQSVDHLIEQIRKDIAHVRSGH